MKIEHNSRSAVYRTPFGAMPAGGTVTLSLAVEGAGIPNFVRLVTDTGRYNMSYRYSVGEYNIYTAELALPEKPCLLRYFFELGINDRLVWYGNNEENLGGIGAVYDREPQEHRYQITVYSPDYKTPDWFKNSICYQIFPDRFCRNGEFLSDKPHMKKRNWGELPYYKAEQFGGTYDCSDFFGGNLAGIEQKLPYLAELGISAIYLNPVFKAFSNHRYDTGDYETIDPLLGTNADFERLCTRAKEYNIRIILDGVFNHTGSDSRYFNKNGSYTSQGAYQSKDSPYYSWYRFSDHPDCYESWWGMLTLPQVEEQDEGYQKYILTSPDSIVKRWLKAGASGWRLDVADELPDTFIKTLRSEVKKTDPEAVIIGEVWEDASNKVAYSQQREYLLGDELDSVMNYPLRLAVIDFALGNIDAAEFDARLSSIRENYPKEVYYSLLNFLSSHDVERILTVLGGEHPAGRDAQAKYRLEGERLALAKRRLIAVMTLVYLMPGVPCIFYGDEAGMQGFSDPFCRGCYPWGAEDAEILTAVKKIFALRKSSDAFTFGDSETLYSYDRGYGTIRIGTADKYITLVNFGGDSCFRIDAARFGITELTDINGDFFRSDDGIFYINMPNNSAKVLKG